MPTKTLTAKEIRQGFIDFFVKKHGHLFVPSSSVVPLEDPTLLFTNAGMNQFKDFFLGTRKPQSTRAVNTQKCIRVSGKHNDLEEVGKDTYHHTFFEMLGNWSFGDYFKEDAIAWAWELLTEYWGIDGTRLWATVFGGDTADGVPADLDAERIWPQKTGIPKERVLRFGRKENFWEMGDVGPCGPCSEIHIDRGPDACDKKHIPGHQCRVNGDCARFIELWNLVFMQYNRDDSGKLKELPAKHVDTGAGLERVVAVLQNKPSNYDTDLFTPIFDKIAALTGRTYTAKLGDENDNAFRVIGDHIRTLTFAITDGATPSNDGRGYVLRRILRRAIRFGLLLNMHEPFLHKIVPTVVETMGDAFPELKARVEHVINVIKAEEESFVHTLERGIQIFEGDVESLKKHNQTALSGEAAFKLYDTYGFPLDLTQLMASERGLTVDTDGFDRLMTAQRERARASQKDSHYEADALSQFLPETDDTQKYHTSTLGAKIVGYVLEGQYLTQGAIPADVKVGVVLNQTCAYAESGGQVGDKGTLSLGSAVFAFTDTQKIGKAVVHFGETAAKDFAVGAAVKLTIDPLRDDVRRNHTATHLLQDALRRVLGTHCHQQGSMVCADYLRFDFTHPKALTADEMRDVESMVRKNINDNHAVTYKVLPLEEAKKLGAMALFSEKYGDHVRVLAIGSNHPDELEAAFSKEFCGGTHVNTTGEIGGFKIVKEESVATGVRRITALTGRGLNHALYQSADQMEQLCFLLKSTPEQLFERVSKLLDDNKQLKKQLKKGAAGDLKSTAQELLDNAATIAGALVIVGEFPAAEVDAIRVQMDWFKKKCSSYAAAIGSKTEDGKVMLFVAVSDDLIAKGLKAGDIVGQIAPIVGGGGGGRPQMAQAGGKNPDKLDEALAAAQTMIRAKLA